VTITRAMPTVFVADMDAAVRFYTGTLGLKLRARHGDHFATVDCGAGSTIGLHPASARHPAGSVAIGFRVSMPLKDTVAELKSVGATMRDEGTADAELNLANFQDVDGTPLYLAELREPRQKSIRIPVWPTLLTTFLAYTTWVAVAADYGLASYLIALRPASWGAQILLDLAIALALVCTWLVRDARQRHRAAWPWVVATPFLGSLAPLTYLVAREREGRRESG